MYVKMTDERTARIVEAACAAPSLHNSQPWQFEAAGDELILRGAVDRALWVADPDARALYISCGAALFNARIAARRAGLDSDVTLLPHPEHPFDVLAVMRLTRGQDPSPGEAKLYEAIWQRHTNRRPYSPARIPRILVAGLQKSAVAEDATLRMLNRQDTAAVLDLAADAGQELAASRAHQDELRRWIKNGADDGIPPWALPDRPAAHPPQFVTWTSSPRRRAEAPGRTTSVTRRSPCSRRSTMNRPIGCGPARRCSTCCWSPRSTGCRRRSCTT